MPTTFYFWPDFQCFSDLSVYESKYAKSLADSDGFWGEAAREYLSWFSPFTSVSSGGFKDGNTAWFCDGELNVSHCCVDRHVAGGKGGQPAIIWEGDEPSECRTVTFDELHQGVCRIANMMLMQGVTKGDTVAVYMPMVPELAMVMLACARIGAVHSVVFAGFSAEALRDRIVYAKSKYGRPRSMPPGRPMRNAG